MFPFHAVLATLSSSYSPLLGRFPRSTHPFATVYCYTVRLACIRHAASVYPEPGSNSPHLFFLDFRWLFPTSGSRPLPSSPISHPLFKVLDSYSSLTLPITLHLLMFKTIYCRYYRNAVCRLSNRSLFIISFSPQRVRIIPYSFLFVKPCLKGFFR
jgi:hypothetical protein